MPTCPYCEENGNHIDLVEEPAVSDSADHEGNHDQREGNILSCPECEYVFN